MGRSLTRPDVIAQPVFRGILVDLAPDVVKVVAQPHIGVAMPATGAYCRTPEVTERTTIVKWCLGVTLMTTW
jgi:hypothetical protein